jgi:hypothetical protein
MTIPIAEERKHFPVNDHGLWMATQPLIEYLDSKPYFPIVLNRLILLYACYQGHQWSTSTKRGFQDNEHEKSTEKEDHTTISEDRLQLTKHILKKSVYYGKCFIASEQLIDVQPTWILYIPVLPPPRSSQFCKTVQTVECIMGIYSSDNDFELFSINLHNLVHTRCINMSVHFKYSSRIYSALPKLTKGMSDLRIKFERMGETTLNIYYSHSEKLLWTPCGQFNFTKSILHCRPFVECFSSDQIDYSIRLE